jgi:hypothetical protein
MTDMNALVRRQGMDIGVVGRIDTPKFGWDKLRKRTRWMHHEGCKLG